MAYPVGVTTRIVSFSPPVIAETGTEPVSKIRVIVSCNNTIIHPATGKVLFSEPRIYSNTDFAIPVTDQSGTWVNEAGAALTSPTHSYRMDMEYLDPATNQWIKFKTLPKVYLITAGGSFDLDTYYDTTKTYYTNT